MATNGAILIGAREVHRNDTFQAIDPRTGQVLGPHFSEAGLAEVEAACAAASEAADLFGELEPSRRAGFLSAIAEEIEQLGDILIEVASAETGLPRGRLENERGRTAGQLRLFAAEVAAGAWLDATIDPALPDRTPPRPDLRRVNVPLGPVAVFGASNFPLAFSVAGGDTASAFAAGCPVVVKGHPAHPGTSELVGRAIRRAVEARGLPEGVFSLLQGQSRELGGALVLDPRIKAVGFTGSRQGGLALADIARQRFEPIPVFAEMSSINPVVLLPNLLSRRAEGLGPAFIASLTLGAGQFCTNPGLIFCLDGPDAERFLAAAADALASVEPQVMLSPQIFGEFANKVTKLREHAAVRQVGSGTVAEGYRCAGALFEAKAADFIDDPALHEEVFGASAIVVRCNDEQELLSSLNAVDGQLTASVHMEEADERLFAQLLPILTRKAGRVLVNGWPTGVEVTPAMVHGGPYPATSDSRTSSVGTLAMMRFLRPVCFQDVPDSLMPAPLRSANPWGIPRRYHGIWERAR